MCWTNCCMVKGKEPGDLRRKTGEAEELEKAYLDSGQHPKERDGRQRESDAFLNQGSEVWADVWRFWKGEAHYLI